MLCKANKFVLEHQIVYLIYLPLRKYFIQANRFDNLNSLGIKGVLKLHAEKINKIQSIFSPFSIALEQLMNK